MAEGSGSEGRLRRPSQGPAPPAASPSGPHGPRARTPSGAPLPAPGAPLAGGTPPPPLSPGTTAASSAGADSLEAQETTNPITLPDEASAVEEVLDVISDEAEALLVADRSGR